MTLPPEAYPADERASLEQTMQAAQTRAEQGSGTPNPTHDLGDFAAAASKILDTEQQASDPEAIRAQLQQKIQTMAEQVYSSLPDGSDRATQMQAFTSRLSIVPSETDPDTLVIHYHDVDGSRLTTLTLYHLDIQGELTVPAELQINVLDCGNNQLTSLPELPATLTVLYCGNNQLTSLPELPASLSGLYCSRNQLASLPELPASLNILYCDGNPFDDATMVMLTTKGFTYQP